MSNQYVKVGGRVINLANITHIETYAGLITIYVVGREEPLEFSPTSVEGKALSYWMETLPSLSDGTENIPIA